MLFFDSSTISKEKLILITSSPKKTINPETIETNNSNYVWTFGLNNSQES